MKKINQKIKDVWKELGNAGFDELISNLQCENPECKDYGKSPKPVKNKDDNTGLSINMLIDCECGNLYNNVEYVVTHFHQK